MKITLIWIFLGGAILLFGDHVGASWNKKFFNRYSRNFFRNANLRNFASKAKNPNNEVDDYKGLLRAFGRDIANDDSSIAFDDGGGSEGQQQNEVYGIVEPLIEDTPCADRPCTMNSDCCPTGVCVETYGEGKCIYVYGRKRDLCLRNFDCDAGMFCVKGPNGNLICEMSTEPAAIKQFGESCENSSECNLTKGLCCQLQRSHHRRIPKKVCSYFRDPFVCIDLVSEEYEEKHKTHHLESVPGQI